MNMQSQTEVKDSFKLLVLASMLTLALWFIPFAEFITYPIRLFVTFIHETGHAVAALATFGAVNRIAIFWSGSGVTETIGGAGFLISSAGYLSTTLFGSALLLWLRKARHARTAAIVTGALLLVVTLFFGGNLGAWLTGLAMGFGCLALGLKAKPRIVHFLMSFLAIQLVLNAFYDLRTLMYLSAFQPALSTDAQNMARATGGFVPAVIWAIGWSVISIAILVITLVIYYRSLKHRAATGEPDAVQLLTEYSERAANSQF